METNVNTNRNRLAYYYGRRVLNFNVPSNLPTQESAATKKPIDSSDYIRFKKNVAIIKARN